MTYGFSPIERPKCGMCGRAFVPACTHCGAVLLDSFLSPGFMGSNEPVYSPDRPENCAQSGRAFPWNSKLRRFVAALARFPARIWSEFKGLSALHITFILVLLLVIFGAIKWDDVLDFLKAIASKKE